MTNIKFLTRHFSVYQKAKYASLIVVTLLLGSGLSTATAQEIDQTQQNTAFDDIWQAVLQGQYDSARQILAQQSDNLPDQLWLEAEIAFHQGEWKKAEQYIRKLIKLLPDQLSFRRRLIEVLVKQNRLTKARLELGRLQSFEQSAKSHAANTTLIRQIDQERPYGYGLSFSSKPSSNINDANPSGTSIGLYGAEYENPDELKPQFGWRTHIGASAFYRYQLSARDQLRFDIRGGYTHYTVDTLDSSFVSLGMSWQRQTSTRLFKLNSQIRKNFGDGKKYQTYYGAEPRAEIYTLDEDYLSYGIDTSFLQKISDRTIIELTSAFTQYRYDSEDFDYKNGQSIAASIGMRYQLSLKDQLGFSLGWGQYREPGGRGDWQNHNNYRNWSTNISWQRNWNTSLITELKLSSTEQTHGYFYPFTNTIQENKTLALSLTIQNLQWQFYGATPIFNCHYSHKDSNLDPFDREDLECGISFGTRF